MKYNAYLFFICVLLSLLYACKNKSTIPTTLNEGEILFRTIQKTTLKIDTHFTLLIIKKNKVKTIYLHQRPHFATIRQLNNPIIQHIHLQKGQKKVIPYTDTISKKMLKKADLTLISDTVYWNTPAQRYQYLSKDTTYLFTAIANMNISPLYLQDIPIVQNYVLDKFYVQIQRITPQEKILMQVIRIESKDIADIEFEYP